MNFNNDEASIYLDALSLEELQLLSEALDDEEFSIVDSEEELLYHKEDYDKDFSYMQRHFNPAKTNKDKHRRRWSKEDFLYKIQEKIKRTRLDHRPLKHLLCYRDVMIREICSRTPSGLARYPKSWIEYIDGALKQAIYYEYILNGSIVPVQWVGGKAHIPEYKWNTEEKFLKAFGGATHTYRYERYKYSPPYFSKSQCPPYVKAYVWKISGKFFCYNREMLALGIPKQRLYWKGK